MIMRVEAMETEGLSVPQTIQEQIALMNDAKGRLLAFVDGLAEPVFDGPSSYAEWSPKDHVAHLGAWAIGVGVLLTKGHRWQAMGLSEAFTAADYDLEKMNEAIYAAYRNISGVEVKAFFNKAHQTILNALATMQDGDLQRPYGFFQPQEQDDGDLTPIISWVAGNTYHHYDEHLAWIKEGLARQLKNN
jgi:hypothetical protein